MYNSEQTDSLDAGLIRAAMAPGMLVRLRGLTLLREIESTNTTLSKMSADSQHAHAVLAERQSDQTSASLPHFVANLSRMS